MVLKIGSYYRLRQEDEGAFLFAPAGCIAVQHFRPDFATLMTRGPANRSFTRPRYGLCHRVRDRKCGWPSIEPSDPQS
ncbi:hypothetical protein BMJ26_14910 [Sinorhizobium medicae]|nr:hypothetical protein BMJ31_18825 [Sinorhizobium medicae]PLU38332.1 hypothetical protein BMJ26_14910 [Sinorhizobium medicae]PLU44762.1 hypothetical protein BMJ28_03700 [Sinorhizobium medicae]PLU46378.1 hypothetical protein BMJ25_18875 [Sinorhizobium medicae]PLU60748.1 hypothetical protein BMJ24_09985 [Sinorhizobium medicae]